MISTPKQAPVLCSQTRNRSFASQIASAATRLENTPMLVNNRHNAPIQRKLGENNELPEDRMPMTNQNNTVRAFLPVKSANNNAIKQTISGLTISRKPQAQTVLTPEEKQQLEDDIIAAVTANGLLGLPPESVKKQWGLVQDAIVKGKSSTYYDDGIKTKIGKLNSGERKALAKDIFSILLGNYKNSNNTAIDYKNEYNSLSSRIKGNIEGGAAGFVTLRDAFFGKFKSIINANYYYQTLVNVDSPWRELKGGQGILVHPQMSESLNRASGLLKNKGLLTTSLSAMGINGIGGFNIRENRNNTKSLSEHSFGFAVDIDADKNPNAKTKDFPAKFVKGFTGTDVYDKQEMKNLAPGSNFDDALKSVQKLRVASDLLKVDFADESLLGRALIAYIHQQQQSKGVNTQNPASWASQYTDSTLISLLKAKDSVNIQACISAAGFIGKDQTSVISFLTEAYALYLKTFKKGNPANGKVPSSSEGTQGSIAAHGFISIPSEITAALISKQGGGLLWLGSVSGGAKDFMHFELSPKPEISVYGDFPVDNNKTEQVA